MAEHEQYVFRYVGPCECSNVVGRLRFVWEEPQYEVVHEPEQVTYECPHCHQMVAVFYRQPELEEEGAKADREMVGQIVQSPCIVSWVGYAKNSRTVPLFEKEVWVRAKETLVFRVNEAMCALGIGYTDAVFTMEHADKFFERCPYHIKGGFYRHARYRLLGEAYRTNPLRRRGFWFQDIPVEGEVVKVVRCVTGSQSPGCAPSGYYMDDGEMPALSGQVHHSLYVVDSGSEWREGMQAWRGVLVHPKDIKEVITGEDS